MDPGTAENTQETPEPNDSERRLDAWLLLPDRDRAELLDGHIVYKAMPSIEHGAAIIAIAGQLDPFQGPPPSGGGWWLSQDVEMYLAGQGLRPDMVGWRIDRHPRPPRKRNVGSRQLGVYVTPPDWVCEVLSPSTRQKDEEEGAKWHAYAEAGVEWYWTVDLSREQIVVHRRAGDRYEAVEVAAGETVKPLPPFQEVPFAVGRVFLMARMNRAEGRQ